MNRRNIILSGLCALAAVATGCMPLSGLRPAAPVPPPLGKSTPPGLDNGGGGAGGIVQAGGTQTADPAGGGRGDLAGGKTVGAYQPPQPPAGTLPPPGMLPPGTQPPRTAAASPVPAAPPGAAGLTAPGTPAPAPLGPGLAAPGDGAGPNSRFDPTWRGGRLDLRPGEVPADRVFELTRQLELVLAQNRELSSRIVELERQGAAREQALMEALREVESAQAEVDKARGIISTQKSELALLQDKIRQMEREDIELLQLVIRALEKALPPAGGKP
ncbi:hypothetical protein GobsT_46610 [Gemmata obscuriglobus]|uniref:Uncharacterized protein n=1 Tax=Gemmata obscuriglobus TaxID=114 RepID=A0A2Z3GVN8_9BACT|nr:hypothetical protein [Gemmata obscuriglobus]AWM37378.1 hypothetical protein C1280_10395 [Gemmata obscuriglobus]QEG29863.1 hypothetical protein GobsT_46610 [Gemmata obscuriglobus]VTS09180.1 unnamed protein product [Gemmata obscuriglobus UQM 2246]